MNNETTNNNSTNKESFIEFNILEFISFAKGKIIYIFAITFIFGLISVAYALYLPNKYLSSAQFEVVQKSDKSSMSSLSEVGGLISGIGFSSSNSDRSSLIVGIAESRLFFKKINSNNNLAPLLMAAESYDLSSKAIAFDKNKYNSNTNTWIRKPPSGRAVKPTYLEAYLDYRKVLTISKNKKTGFISISVEHVSPIFAKELIEIIWNNVNNIIREKDMKESFEALDYLNSELLKSTNSDIRRSINNLISIKLETQMLTKIKKDYVLTPIDSPYVPEVKSSPKRSLICILGTIIGFLIAVSFTILQYMHKKLEG